MHKFIPVSFSRREIARNMTTTLELRVHMDCPGCQSKVRSALRKLKGVDNVDIDMELQKVTVTGWAEQKKVLKAVRKTGRRAELWQLPYNPDHDNYGDPYPQHELNGPVPRLYGPQPTSCYNYFKHGYDNHDQRAYYQNYPPNSTFIGRQAGSAFSDDNVHNCSIM